MPAVNVRKRLYDEMVRRDLDVNDIVNRAVAEKLGMEEEA